MEAGHILKRRSPVSMKKMFESNTNCCGFVRDKDRKSQPGILKIADDSPKHSRKTCSNFEQSTIYPNKSTTKEHENSDLMEYKTLSLSRRMKKYVVALRPWSFTASFTPVALGSTLAFKSTGHFCVLNFLVTCLTAVAVHAAGNLVNTYFDYIKGIDSKKSDDRTLVDHILKPVDVAWLGSVFYVIGCLGFLCLTFLSSARVEHLALIYFGGLSSSFIYTGGLGLKYVALGDLLIFFTFGPVTVAFSFLCQGGPLSLIPILYALPLALNTEAILHSNNTRDMDEDKKSGIVTLAIILGKTGSYMLFTFLLFAPYIIFVLMATNYTKWMFLPCASAFFAFKIEKSFRNSQFMGMPSRVALLNLILGVMYVIACIFAEKKSLPGLV